MGDSNKSGVIYGNFLDLAIVWAPNNPLNCGLTLYRKIICVRSEKRKGENEKKRQNQSEPKGMRRESPC